MMVVVCPPSPESIAPEPTELSPLLLAALEQTRSSACITTADLDAPGPVIVYVNPAYCTMTGRRREEVLGSSPRLMQGPLTDRNVLDRLRRQLGAGQRFEGETVNYRTDGTPFLISWSIDPVRDAGGTVTHFVATQEDVTDQVRAQNLLQATQALDQTLTRVMNSTVDRETARETLVDTIVSGARQVAGVGAIRAVLFDDDDATSVLSSSDAGSLDGAATDVQIVFGQAMSRSRGMLSVAELSASERAFVDVDGLERYGERAALVVGSLFEYQRQQHAAIRLQRSLLPSRTVDVAGFDIVGEYLPGAAGLEIGGDWFDTLVVDDCLFVSVGDVSGSGIDAAALMGRLSLLGAHELKRGSDVAELFSVLDEVCREVSQLATMQLARINTSTGCVDLWSAGHLPPIRFSDASPELQHVDVAPPLGFLGDIVVPHTSLHLEPGSGLFLYTDGLVERRTEMITTGLERLRVALAGSTHLSSMVQRALDAAGNQATDDVAIIAVARR